MQHNTDEQFAVCMHSYNLHIDMYMETTSNSEL